MVTRLPLVPTGALPASAFPGPPPDETGLEEGKPLKVGELAEQTGKTVRALHLYEELGLLRPLDRSKGSFRLYGPAAVARVRWISKLQEMAFSLPEIREVVLNWERSASAPDAMQRLRELYRERLRQTRDQIDRLQALARDLEQSIGYLDTCDACEPEREVQACTCCDHHGCEPPDLVAGLQRHVQ